MLLRRLTNVLVAGSCLAVLASAAFFAVPHLAEWHLSRTCALYRPSDDCVISTRRLGHLWYSYSTPDRAAYWFERAAYAGDAEAMFYLAWMLEQQGENRTALAGAKKWYKRAALKGFGPAMNNYASLLFVEGADKGIAARDSHRVWFWFDRGCEAGTTAACWNRKLKNLQFGPGQDERVHHLPRLALAPTPAAQNQIYDGVLERTHLFGRYLPAPLRSVMARTPGKSDPIEFRIRIETASYPPEYDYSETY